MGEKYGHARLDYDKLRGIVEHLRGRDVPDEVWNEVQQKAFLVGLDYTEDAWDVSDYIRENALEPEPSTSTLVRRLEDAKPACETVLEGPAEWRVRSAVILDSFRDLQRQALQLVIPPRWMKHDGGAFDRDDLEWLLVGQAEAEPKRGDKLDLCFGLRRDNSGHYSFSGIEVYRGYNLDEYYGRLEGWGPARLERDADEWRDEMGCENRLAKIVDLAMQVVRVTRCKQWGAIDFLLCDEPFEMPWIRAGRWPGAAGGWITVEAHAGATREEIWAAVTATRAGHRPRRMQDQTLKLLLFDAQHEGLGRDLRCEMWNDRDDVVPYASPGSYSAAVSAAKSRLMRGLPKDQ